MLSFIAGSPRTRVDEIGSSRDIVPTPETKRFKQEVNDNPQKVKKNTRRCPKSPRALWIGRNTASPPRRSRSQKTQNEIKTEPTPRSPRSRSFSFRDCSRSRSSSISSKSSSKENQGCTAGRPSLFQRLVSWQHARSPNHDQNKNPVEKQTVCSSKSDISEKPADNVSFTTVGTVDADDASFNSHTTTKQHSTSFSRSWSLKKEKLALAVKDTKNKIFYITGLYKDKKGVETDSGSGRLTEKATPTQTYDVETNMSVEGTGSG